MITAFKNLNNIFTLHRDNSIQKLLRESYNLVLTITPYTYLLTTSCDY